MAAPAPGHRGSLTTKNSESGGIQSCIVKLVAAVFALVALVTLPIVILVRTATYLYLVQGVNHWVSILAGMVALTILLAIYLAGASLFVKSDKVFSANRFKLIAVVVSLCCLYGILYTSGAHFKSESVRTTYTSLHPILRLATSALFVVDSKAVVTDISRVPEDYSRMGLSVNENSLHYKQADGYAHAVDLRTNGRSWFRNIVVVGYFRILGLRTLRHVGTADHIHISLPNPR